MKTGKRDARDITKWSQYDYGPFGEVIRSTGPMAKVNPFRWSTKYQDDETDLLYYGYRYYSASTGRWLSRDPVEERGGKNLYGFVRNAPIDSVDYLGLACGPNAEAKCRAKGEKCFHILSIWIPGTDRDLELYVCYKCKAPEQCQIYSQSEFPWWKNCWYCTYLCRSDNYSFSVPLPKAEFPGGCPRFFPRVQ